MPKTKDAFAFRDFDSERILQRNFFIEFDPSAGTDEEILSAYDSEQFPEQYLNLSTRIIEAQRGKLRWFNCFVAYYQSFLRRHYERLLKLKSKFAEKFILTVDPSLKRKYERTDYLLNRYQSIADALQLLREKNRRLSARLLKLYDRQWQKEFGERLRDARRAKGLTQTQLAGLIGEVSRDAIQRYESGVADISSRNLLKVTKILGVSADSLLSLK